MHQLLKQLFSFEGVSGAKYSLFHDSTFLCCNASNFLLTSKQNCSCFIKWIDSYVECVDKLFVIPFFLPADLIITFFDSFSIS